VLVEPQLEDDVTTRGAKSPRSKKPHGTPCTAAAGLGELEHSPPFDRAHLAKFTFGDLAVESEILTLFAEQLPRLVNDLEQAELAETWMVAAHTLKGSSRAIGAWDLAATAAQAESLSWQPAGEDAEAALERYAVVARLKRLSSLALAYIEAEIG